MARSRYATHVGASLAVLLAERRRTQADLAEALKQSPSYLSKVVTGAKPPSPEWLDLVADTLALSREQRRALHHAGARDVGFKLDLTTDD